MSILIFVFSLSLSQYRCLCRFLYICLCLNISTIELTWLFWKCADVTGKLNSRLWTSGAFPAKSNIRFFKIFRAQQFNLQSWLDLILTLKFWKMRNISRLVCYFTSGIYVNQKRRTWTSLHRSTKVLNCNLGSALSWIYLLGVLFRFGNLIFPHQ